MPCRSRWVRLRRRKKKKRPSAMAATTTTLTTEATMGAIWEDAGFLGEMRMRVSFDDEGSLVKRAEFGGYSRRWLDGCRVVRHRVVRGAAAGEDVEDQRTRSMEGGVRPTTDREEL